MLVQSVMIIDMDLKPFIAHEIEGYQEKLWIISMILMILDVLMLKCWSCILPLCGEAIW